MDPSEMERLRKFGFTNFSPLEHAILEGDPREVLKVLRNQKKITVKPLNNLGDTILHLLLKHTRFLPSENIIEVLNMLLQRHVDPNVTNCKKETVLHLAIRHWNKDLINPFLLRGARVNMADIDGNTVAHFFVKEALETFLQYSEIIVMEDDRANNDTQESKSVEFTEWMLEKGFNFDCPNKMGQTALHLAIQYNLQPILTVLLRHTRNINSVNGSGQTLLHLLFTKNSVKNPRYRGRSDDSIERYMYKKFKGSNVSQIKVDSSVFSKEYGTEIVRILFERGISVDQVDNDGNTALHLAIDSAKTEADMKVVKMLFDSFILFESTGQSLLCKLMKYTNDDCYFKIAATLIAKGVKVDEKNANSFTPLYCAFRHKNLRAIELMKKNGADFGVITQSGDNLLHALAENPPDVWTAHSQNELFDFLISQGCKVNEKNEEGETPLNAALDNDNIVVIRRLIVRGADINCRNHKKDWSPLHHMAAANVKDTVEVAELLLKNGAQINSKCLQDGSRPIHLAAEIPHSSTFKLLLRHKAEVNVRDFDGNSPLVKALIVDSFANVKELLAYGADVNDDCVIRALSKYWKNSAGDFLLQHSIKLQALGLFCSNGYKPFLAKAPHEWLYRTCLKEVDKLKSTFIDNRTTLYQWLRMDPNRRQFHENLRNTVESESLLTQFPLYSNVILGHYRECEARRQLLEPAKEALMKLIRVYLPDICLERILNYSITRDLLEIIELGRAV